MDFPWCHHVKRRREACNEALSESPFVSFACHCLVLSIMKHVTVTANFQHVSSQKTCCRPRRKSTLDSRPHASGLSCAKRDDRGREPGCPGPPAQIRAGALTHPAPALGVDGETLGGPRVTDGGSWPVEVDEATQRRPSVAVLLRAPAQGAQEHSFDREDECLESTRCAGDGVAVQPSVDDPSEPSGNFVFAEVHSPSEFFLDAPEGAPHPLSGWFASDPEFPSQGLGAEVRHAQKVEGFRFPLPTFLSVCSREPSELDEPGLVRMHVQPKSGEPFP